MCPSRASSYPFLLAVSRTALLLCLARGHAWCCDIETPAAEAVIRPCGGRSGRGSHLPQASGAGHRGPAGPLALSGPHCDAELEPGVPGDLDLKLHLLSVI